MSDTPGDAEIVRGLRHGDRRAWEALCKQYSPRVWRYVARLVGPKEDAVSEIFQETMLAVARAGRNLSEETKLWPWLAAIGHNQTALYWRNAARARRLCLEVTPAESAPFEEPLEMLLRAERAELVRGLLAEMQADAVALLAAKYLDGLTVGEIVELMGGTPESVRSRLARARRDFRARYERAAQNQNRAINPAVQENVPPEGDFS